MDVKYIYHRPDGSASDPCGRTRALAVAAARLVKGTGRFQLKKDGDLILTNGTRVDTIAKLSAQLKRGEVGPTWRVRRGDGQVVFWVRAVKDAPDVIDTSGNTKSDQWWTFVKTNYAKYNPRFAGSYVCKDIAGSTTLSQHSYGNAVDIFFDSMKHQEEVAQEATRGHCARNVISGDRIFHREHPGDPGSWGHYDGEFHSHLHCDWNPQCSGKCGVQETGPCKE